MDTCDVLIVGGGPAGSACAWKLGQAGLDVVVMDAAVFPRDKVCAGWITPRVVDELGIDAAEYRRGRTLQPITGFRTGLVGGHEEVETVYDHPVSFGIRRCEFDHYLLQRSEARLALGTRLSSLRRDGGRWIVNDTITAPVLVGAGGHFCPVARWLNGPLGDTPVVAAQEVEFAIDPRDAAEFTIEPDTPELYFCRDLRGYGWCFRKHDYLNVGFGRLDRRGLPKATAEFVDFLKRRRKIPRHASWRWHGHAYLLYEMRRRRVLDVGVLLIGDAAGLAYSQSGEGIRPAIESGLLAASTLIEANGCYTRDRLELYQQRCRARFDANPLLQSLSRAVSPALTARAAAWLLDMPWFVRHVVLNRWFLHALDPALVLQ
jgi:flavin-dependent dehydrogenase